MKHLVSILFLVSLFVTNAVFAAKPTAPVSLNIEYVEDSVTGHFNIELTLLNLGAQAQYALELQLAPGAEHFSGPLIWSGLLPTGGSEQFLYEISFGQESYIDLFVKSGANVKRVVRKRFMIKKGAVKEKPMGVESFGQPKPAKERIRGPYIEYPLK